MTGRLAQMAQELVETSRRIAAGDFTGPSAIRNVEDQTRALEDAVAATEREVALLRETANATQADLEQKLEEISLFRSIGDLSASLLESEDPFRPILHQLLFLSHATSGSIFMLDGQTGRLEFMSAAGGAASGRPVNRPSFERGEGIAGRVAQTGEPLLIGDTQSEAEFQQRADTAVPIRSLVCFPLATAEQTMGVLNLSAPDPGVFTKETLRVLHVIAGQLSNLIQNARLLAQRRAYVARIEESERRYRELVEEVNDGFFLMDAAGRTLVANDRLADIFGRRRAAVLGAETWAEFLTPDTRDRVLRGFARIQEDRPGLEEDLEFAVRHQDGREVPVHMHCRTVAQEGVLVWIGMVRDMTAQKVLQRQLLQTEKLASMGTLIAGTTHELNNKLAPILGYAQLLQQMDIPADMLPRMRVIQEAAEGAKNIIDALLGFSRDSDVQREPIRIADSVDAVLGISQAALRRAGVRIVRYDDPDVPLVHVARQQIEQVLLNMVNNGMHAMADAEQKTLEIWTRADGPGVVIGVRDTGCGIAPEHLTRIFDPFFTTKQVNEGTGLGLSLSYGIVRSHGGEIHAESQVGRGTTFRIQLPVGSPEVSAQGVDMLAAPVRAWRGKPRILIIDDEGLVRDLLTELFAENCEVATAEHGRAALGELERTPFDLLLVDVRMPELDGMGFFDAVRQDYPQLADHVIFMTGDTYDPETRRFLDGAGRPFLSKPFNIQDVVATVHRELFPGE